MMANIENFKNIKIKKLKKLVSMLVFEGKGIEQIFRLAKNNNIFFHIYGEKIFKT